MTQQSHPQRRAPSSRTPPRAAFRIILALAASLSLTVGTRDAHAQNATIRLSVDKHLVGVAEAVQITVQLSVAGRASYTQYVPPKMDGFRVSSQGMTSQNIAVVNWHIRRRESYAYTAIPVKLGTFKIGPAAIHVGKRWIRSNVETITVKRGAGSPQTPRPGFSSPPGNAPPTATGVPSGVPTQRVFIMGSVTPQKAYVGQQVVALWQLYTQSDVLGFRTLKQPTTDGFWSDDLKSPRRLEFARHVVQGRIYYLATLAKKALFPQRPGKLTIGPMGAMVRTLDTFSTSSKRHSDPLTIEVLPLPAQGKPKAFPEQNVGHYAMTATLDRKTIKAGDAVTLKIIVRGTGNLRQLAIPKLTTIPGLRIYEPKTTDHIDNTSRIAGEKTIEYLLLPTRAGKIAIPRLVLTYFDPRTQRYRKAQSRILTLTVRGKFSGAPQTTGSARANVLGPDIRPPRPAHTLAHRQARTPIGPLRLGLILAPLAFLLIVTGGERLRARLARQTERSLGRRSLRRVRAHLRQARDAQRKSNATACFGALTLALHEQLAHQLGARTEGMTRDELRATTTAQGFAAEVVDALLSELDNYDFARFAPSASGDKELHDAVSKTSHLVNAVAKTRVRKVSPPKKTDRGSNTSGGAS